MSSAEAAPLYAALLGAAYGTLPPLVQAMHRVAPRVEADGVGTVTRGDNAVARWLADRLGMPAAGIERPLHVSFTQDRDGERLSRRYPDVTLTTLQAPGGPPGSGRLAESFGPVTLQLRLEPSPAGLSFHLERTRWHGLPLPGWLQPRVTAREGEADGWYRFFVRIDLPLLGRLIQYEGRLHLLSPPAPRMPAA